MNGTKVFAFVEQDIPLVTGRRGVTVWHHTMKFTKSYAETTFKGVSNLIFS